MMRISILFLLAVIGFPGQGVGQGVATLFERDDARDLASVITALEVSRDALLQARESVDTALIEVDHALGMLRGAAIAKFSPGTAPPSLWSAPRAAPRFPSRLWIDAVTAAIAQARLALNHHFMRWQPYVDDLRLAACRAQIASEHAEPNARPAVALLRAEKSKVTEVVRTAPRDGALQATTIPRPPAALPSSGVDDALATNEAVTSIVVMPTAPAVAEPALPTVGSP